MWYIIKILLKRRFMALNASLGKEERSQTNDLSFHFKKLEKEVQIKFKVQERK